MSSYVVNRHVRIGLTNIFVFDASDGTYTECIGLTPPYNLLPPIPAIGDILYLGIDSSIANEYPKCIVFDMIKGSDYTAVIEHYDGAWVNGFYFDWTYGFLRDGDCSITYNQFNNVNVPLPVVVNGVNGYWLRIRISAIGAAPKPPIQINRQVFACEWSFAETSDIPGDTDALCSIKMQAALLFSYKPSALICGLRSQHRGEDYSPYIHFDTVNSYSKPKGITVTAIAPAVASTATANFSPVQQSIRYAPAGAAGITKVAEIEIDPEYSWQWIGRYHPFLVGYQAVSWAGISGRYYLEVSLGNVTNVIDTYQSRGQFTDIFLRYERTVNFSELTIPERAINARIYISVYADIQNPQINNYHSLILIPSDENLIEISLQDEQLKEYYRVLSISSDQIVVTDPISIPKRIVTMLTDRDYESIVFTMFTKTPAYPMLHNIVKQRLWFFSFMHSWHTGEYKTNQHFVFRIDSRYSARYLSGRGNL